MDAIVLPHDGDEPADLDDALLVQGYAEAAAGEDAAVETLRLRYLSLAGLADMVAPAVFAGWSTMTRSTRTRSRRTSSATSSWTTGSGTPPSRASGRPPCR